MPSIDIAPNLVADLRAIGIIPSDIVLYINSQCNLRCTHCYVGNDLLDASIYYSLGSLLEFIHDLPALDRVTVLGGEPFYHPRLEEIAEALGDHPCAERRITTNLTIFNERALDALRTSSFRICVSLDGHTAKLHDEVRGRGAFEKTYKNLEKIVRSGHDVEVTNTLTSENIDGLWDFIKLCKSTGIQRLNLHRISLRGNALSNRHLDVTPTRWRKLTTELEMSSSKHERPLLVRYEAGFATEAEYKTLIATQEYKHHTQSSFYSSADGRRIVIFPNKRIFVSSEAFGTDSHIGDFEAGYFRFNHLPSNETIASQRSEYKTTDINSEIVGDTNYPIPLSVSFRRTVRI
jgi:MoaA/NifB/PqqE/SkfB family radical SAM enzyme